MVMTEITKPQNSGERSDKMSSEIYVVYSNGDLATINTATYAVHEIGNTGVPVYGGVALTDIGFAPTGALYGISFNELYKINTHTGAATAIGALDGGAGDMNALTFGSNGKAYAYSAATDFLYTINLKTGLATALSHASGYYSAGDLSFYDGKLLLAGFSPSGGDDLVTLNPTTGAATHAVADGLNSLFGLIATNSTHLYGFDLTELYALNAKTGTNKALANVQLPGDSADYITGSAFDGYFKQRATIPQTAEGWDRMAFVRPPGSTPAKAMAHADLSAVPATNYAPANAYPAAKTEYGAVQSLGLQAGAATRDSVPAALYHTAHISSAHVW